MNSKFDVTLKIKNGRKFIDTINRFPASKNQTEYTLNVSELAASLFDCTSAIEGYSVIDDIVYHTCSFITEGISDDVIEVAEYGPHYRFLEMKEQDGNQKRSHVHH